MMTWLELVTKLAPWLFIFSVLLFIFLLLKNIKTIRREKFEQELMFGEKEIDEKYSHYTDTDVLNELNRKGDGRSDPK